MGNDAYQIAVHLRQRLVALAERVISDENEAVSLVGLVDELIEILKPPTSAPAPGEDVPRGPLIFSWPTDYKIITQRWGERPEVYAHFKMREITRPKQDGHEGIDVRTGRHGRIYAIAAGRVYEVVNRGNYGYQVRIEHSFADGLRLRSIYAHMEAGSAKVKPGDLVVAGRMIGYSGKTGNTEAEHLHLSIYEFIESDSAWYLVDPMKFLDEALKA